MERGPARCAGPEWDVFTVSSFQRSNAEKVGTRTRVGWHRSGRNGWATVRVDRAETTTVTPKSDGRRDNRQISTADNRMTTEQTGHATADRPDRADEDERGFRNGHHQPTAAGAAGGPDKVREANRPPR